VAAVYILMSVHSTRRAKEAALQEDVHTLQAATTRYTVDHGRPPQSQEDLVEGGYLKAVPGSSIELREQ